MKEAMQCACTVMPLPPASYRGGEHSSRAARDIGSNSMALFHMFFNFLSEQRCTHRNTGRGTLVYGPVFGSRQCYRSSFIPLRPHRLGGPT